MPLRAKRLAELVITAATSDTDFRSVAALCAASAVGASPSTVRSWCRREHIEARRLLDLARVLRALSLAVRYGNHPSDYLDVDSRTLASMLGRGGIGTIDGSITIEQFCRCQHYAPHGFMVTEIIHLLALRAVDAGCSPKRPTSSLRV